MVILMNSDKSDVISPNEIQFGYHQKMMHGANLLSTSDIITQGIPPMPNEKDPVYT